MKTRHNEYSFALSTLSQVRTKRLRRIPTSLKEVFLTCRVGLYCMKRSCTSVARLGCSLGTLVTLTISHYNGFFKLVDAEELLQI